MYKKTTDEMFKGTVRAHAGDTFASALKNLDTRERESIKEALRELGRMLSDLSYRKVQDRQL